MGGGGAGRVRAKRARQALINGPNKARRNGLVKAFESS